MAERGLSVDHISVWRGTQVYSPEVHRRLRGEVKRKSSTWHMDETFVRVAGRWMYLFRAVDNSGQTWTSTSQKRGIARPLKSF
jgi:IS6 family transposase